VNVEQAAAAAAAGALQGAGDVGAAAVDQVRRTATGLIGGVKVVAAEPFRRRARRPETKAS
jgi:hypothetical protein